MSLQSKALGYFSGVNWYLLAAKAAVVAAALTLAFISGQHRCELKHANEETKKAQIIYRDVVHEVQVRVPEIQYIEKETTGKNQVVKVIGDKLDEANKSPTAGSCNLSPDQLRYFQELAKATQH